MDADVKKRRENQIQTLKDMRNIMLESENWESMKNLIEAVTAGGMSLQILQETQLKQDRMNKIYMRLIDKYYVAKGKKSRTSQAYLRGIKDAMEIVRQGIT